MHFQEGSHHGHGPKNRWLVGSCSKASCTEAPYTSLYFTCVYYQVIVLSVWSNLTYHIPCPFKHMLCGAGLDVECQSCYDEKCCSKQCRLDPRQPGKAIHRAGAICRLDSGEHA